MKDSGQKGERHGTETEGEKDVEQEGEEKCIMDGRKMWNEMKKNLEMKEDMKEYTELKQEMYGK